MNTLPPLPFETSEESRSFRQIDIEGFVDEQVVSRAIARGAYDRTPAVPGEMVLSSSAEDYAGWAPPVESPFRKMAERPAPTPTPTPAPAPAPKPLAPRPWGSMEADVETPYRGGHRWWFFGTAGAIACGIVALSLMGLAQHRNNAEITDAGIPEQKWHEAPAAGGNSHDIQPSLTKALPADR